MFSRGGSMLPFICADARSIAAIVSKARGTLEARAMMATEPTKAVAVDSIRTSGKAAGLKMTLVWPSRTEPLRLHGKGAAMVQVQAVDADGVFVPDANVRVDFRVSAGPAEIVGVGNGDPSSHESDKAAFRSTFNGLVRCIVQTIPGEQGSAAARRDQDQVVVEATAQTAAGMVSAKLAILLE